MWKVAQSLSVCLAGSELFSWVWGVSVCALAVKDVVLPR